MTQTQTAPLARKTWLVQRLNRPSAGFAALGKDNPFAFGGGYKNGGLSDDAMDLLRPLFSFDYMGSAEFEFGAVPEALQKIAQHAEAGSLTAFSFALDRTDVEKPWRLARDKDAVTVDPDEPFAIYVIAPTAQAEAVQERITGWAKESPKGVNSLKESLHLDLAAWPIEDDWSRTEGWLELDNGFMFFTSRPMWEGVSALFGLSSESEDADG